MHFKSLFMTMTLAGALLSSCGDMANQQKDGAQGMGEVIGKSTIKVDNGLMTPEVLYSFGRIGDVVLSPDKSKIQIGRASCRERV